MQITKKSRKSYLDFLRVLATFLVIYNHTAGCSYYLHYTNETYKIIACIALSSLTSINVPLFFMLSGALLLKKEESYRTLFSKRILRFGVVLTGASVLTYGSTYFLYEHDLNLKWFLRALISCEISTIYWFLYTYLGFLLALPFLRKLAKQLNRQDIVLLVAFQIVFSSVLRIYEYFAGFLGYDPVLVFEGFTLPFAMTDMLFYPLVGYYLEHQVQIEKYGKKEAAVLLGLLLCGIGVSTAITYHEGIYWTGFTDSYLGIFDGLVTICVFLLTKMACCRMRKTKIFLWLGTMTGKLSELTLGIYLLDPIFRKAFADCILAPAGESLYLVPLSLVYCCISISVCGAITWLLKKLPAIKDFL